MPWTINEMCRVNRLLLNGPEAVTNKQTKKQ